MNKKLVYTCIGAFWILASTSIFAFSWEIRNDYKFFGNSNFELISEEYKLIQEKLENWETLTQEEQTILDSMKKPRFQDKKGRDRQWGFGGFRDDFLTEDEKEAFNNLTSDEKKEYLEAKRLEEKSKMELKELVIDKLLIWESLTSEEEVIRQEIITERANRKTFNREEN